MATPDPLSAVSPDVAARTKAILEAVATGGSAGLKAYEQSQTSMTQAKTDAVTRAQQRASLIGGPESQGFEQAAAGQYDRGISNLGTARTGFEGHMASLGSAHKNYLDQVNAAVPLVRADTDRQLALKQQALNDALDREMAKEAKADAKAAAKENKLTKAQLLGSGQALSDQYADFVGMGRGSEGTFSAEESARALAAYKGIPDAEVHTLLGPRVAPKTPVDSVAKSLATKYDTKGVTYDLAKSVVNNVDYQAAVRDIYQKAAEGGYTRDEIEAHLRQEFLVKQNWPSEYHIAAGELLSMFPDE